MRPHAIEANLKLFAQYPNCAFVYGAYRVIDKSGVPQGPPFALRKAEPDPYAAFLKGDCIGMHATAMYRRERLQDSGGFDPALGACEDYDVYLRLSRKFPVACHAELIADYRRHDSNMSNDVPMMLRTTLEVLERQRQWAETRPEWTEAHQEGVKGWKQYYVEEFLRRSVGQPRRGMKPPSVPIRIQSGPFVNGSGMPLGVSAYWFAGATLTGTILTSVQFSARAPERPLHRTAGVIV